MSEEILKALMQLFAIIAGQDEGASDKEKDYVELFLRQTLSPEEVPGYLRLFNDFLHPTESSSDTEKESRASMLDSVMSLKICRQINNTLDQKQKNIVLIRMLELANAAKQLTPARMGFIETSAKIFNIDDYQAIHDFVVSEDASQINIPSILVIDNKKDEPAWQRKHMRSKELDGELVILNLKNSNLFFLKYQGSSDIYLNGLPVNRDQIYLFAYGGAIKLPKGDPIYYSDISSIFLSDTIEIQLSFIARNVEHRFPNGTIGVRDVNISEGPGRLIALMGASGSGKTTLFSILSGIEKPTKGEVFINGINIHTEQHKIEGVIGSVAQDDALFEKLTVFQNLYYNAKLCFKHMSNGDIEKLCLKILNSLGMSDIRDLEVGSPMNKKISGGQRKRLNIALELIREPTVLFLDEPTSGLSSRDSENIMDLLKELAFKGKLIFVVIHQPSSDIYKMFDEVLMLDEGGYPVYYGNPVEAVMYFKRVVHQLNSEQGQCPECGNVNPELIFNIIESKVMNEYGDVTEKRKISARHWNEIYNEKISSKKITEINTPAPTTLDIAGKLSQFVTFIRRDVMSKLKNTQYLAINLLEAPLLAFALAFIVRYISDPATGEYIFRENKNIPAYFFTSIIVALFIGLTVSAEEIFRDRKILKRESFLNLSWGSYLMSKMSILFLLSAIQMALFVLVGNYILEIKGMGLFHWLILFSVACSANILGLNISSAFNSAVTIYILIPILLIPQMILGGAMFKFEELNQYIGGGKYKVPLIAELMVSRWSYEAMLVHQFKKNDYQDIFFDLDKEKSKANFKQAFLIPKLQTKLDRSLSYLASKMKDDKPKLEKNLALLKAELTQLNQLPHLSKFEFVDQLTAELYSQETARSLRQHLQKINVHFNEQYRRADHRADQIVLNIQSTPEKKALFKKLKDQYHNDYLAMVVRNRESEYAIVETDNRFVQRMDPIYMEPQNIAGILDFRTHFFAPVKHFASRYYSTLYFNASLIWVISLIMAILLYFEVFKKVMNTDLRLMSRGFRRNK